MDKIPQLLKGYICWVTVQSILVSDYWLGGCIVVLNMSDRTYLSGIILADE